MRSHNGILKPPSAPPLLSGPARCMSLRAKWAGAGRRLEGLPSPNPPTDALLQPSYPQLVRVVSRRRLPTSV
jgi:hypothetical protein